MLIDIEVRSLGRIARPTFNLIKNNLANQGEIKNELRLIESGRLYDLPNLSTLNCSIVKKAADSFGADSSLDSHEGKIKCVKTLTLLEIKAGGERGAVWQDDKHRYNWLVASGRAKGEHKDHDDFYNRLGRADSGGSIGDILPSKEDYDQLATELDRFVIHQLQVSIAEVCNQMLEETLETGSSCHHILMSVDGKDKKTGNSAGHISELTRVHLEFEESTFVDDADGCETVPLESCFVITFHHADLGAVNRNIVSELNFLAAMQIEREKLEAATTNNGDIWYFMEITREELSERKDNLLSALSDDTTLDNLDPSRRHWAPKEDITDGSVNNHPVRSLCGTYFTPITNGDKYLECEKCNELYSKLEPAPST